MLYQSIEQFITRFPIYQYEIINSSEVEFDAKVRAFCKKECSRYGTSWSCPPAIVNIDRCKAKCVRFPKALIFSTIADVSDDEKAIMGARRRHGQTVRQITKFLRVNNVPCHSLSTDECSLCEKCTYPKRPCPHPDAMIPCLESHGIVLLNMMGKLQMDYLMENGTKIWFGIIFLEEE